MSPWASVGTDCRATARPARSMLGRPALEQRRCLPGCSKSAAKGLDICSFFVLISVMSDRPASWRMPSPQQMEKLAAKAVRKASEGQPTGVDATAMPAEYWDAELNDPRADARSRNVPLQQRRLSEIHRHVLRVTCRRCDRIVEIQIVDAVRLYGAHAIWKDVGMRLLDNTCRERTRSREDDGCWPAFE